MTRPGRGRRGTGSRGFARRGGEQDADPATEPDGADPELVAKDICLRLLTGRARTRQELADALRRRGVDDGVVESVLGRLATVGLIDDAAFAQTWVSSRHRNAGAGRRLLSVELARKGVAGEAISGALEELDPATEEATARRLVERRLPALRGQPAEVKVRRLAAMLGRKGYPAGLASRIVRDALASEEIPDQQLEALETWSDDAVE